MTAPATLANSQHSSAMPTVCHLAGIVNPHNFVRAAIVVIFCQMWYNLVDGNGKANTKEMVLQGSSMFFVSKRNGKK